VQFRHPYADIFFLPYNTVLTFSVTLVNIGLFSMFMLRSLLLAEPGFVWNQGSSPKFKPC